MMEDIDAKLRAVLASRGQRDNQAFSAMLQRLAASSDGLKAEWDPEAGEKWGRILSPDTVVALVHVRLPMAVLRSSHSADLRKALTNPSMVVVEVPDWKDLILSARLETLEEFAGYRVERDIDPDKFSAADLWFISV
jgi:hypothetical protein